VPRKGKRDNWETKEPIKSESSKNVNCGFGGGVRNTSKKPNDSLPLITEEEKV